MAAAETVMEPGEFAVRGGLVDLFRARHAPSRCALDLFGDVLEEIRSFDPMSQRSTGAREEVVLLPVSEVLRDQGTASSAFAAAIASCSAMSRATTCSTRR